MDFGIWDIFNIFGSLALFIYGMKIMSEGIQKAAGSTFRNILRNMTKNRWYALLTGVITTSAVQSSSVTTVMTVSFVNAGLLTLIDSAGIMIGANIGTTITGWLAAILQYKVNIHELSLPLLVLAVPLLFSKKDRYSFWGEFLVGFSILFLGLNFLSLSVPSLDENLALFEWVKKFSEGGILVNLLFVLLGMIITVVLQSSSAAMVLTMTMALKGWVPFEIAAALILGENIGTTLTAEIAALVANVHAKRSARIHTLFNLLGVSWMILVLPIFLSSISWFLTAIMGQEDPFSTVEAIPIALSIFHTAFNAINAIIFIFLIPYLVALAKWTIPIVDKKNDKNKKPNLIGNTINSPELATVELKKDTAHFAEMIARMSRFVKEYFNSVDEKEQLELYSKILKYEDITDRMRDEITEYITRLSKSEMTTRTSIRLRSLLNVSAELERIADIYLEIAQGIRKKFQSKVWFNPIQRSNVNKMMSLIDHSINETLSNLRMTKYHHIDPDVCFQLNKKVKELNSRLRKEYFDLSSQEDLNINSVVIYNILINSLSTIQKHIHEITESITDQN
jgi:phosphate:Na+ symporter